MTAQSDPRPPLPPGTWKPLVRLVRRAGRPLERFLHVEAASAILLFVATAIALAWANSPWSESYARVWHTPLGVRAGPFSFEQSLEWCVNDGLMVIFFFVVGMEIRRELHHGALSTWQRAALPVAGALGGMIAPAALYLALAGDPATRAGWGVPMATDIAFAVGIFTLLGKRIPAALYVVLLAVAVIDDLGAIVVIALFYSSGVTPLGVLVAGSGVAGILTMQYLGVRMKLAYVAPALVVWAGIYTAGVHPTIAGVIVGLMTPVRAWFGRDGFVVGVHKEMGRLAEADPGAISAPELSATLHQVGIARREAVSPAESLIESLHPWVAFGIMPVFALANAGISLSGLPVDASALRVAAGVTAGLVVGKPAGVLLASVLALRLRIASLPPGVGLRHLVVLGVVAGVGFTMAIFIAQLAFAETPLLAAAKVGVFVASGLAAIFGLLLGWIWLAPMQAVPGSQPGPPGPGSVGLTAARG